MVSKWRRFRKWFGDLMYNSAAAFVSVMMVAITLLCTLVLWGVNGWTASSCRERTQLYNLTFVDYSWKVGCVIKTENGTVTDLDSYLTIRDGRE